jgi:hypothetical protein
MWKFNSEKNKWESTVDSLTYEDFNFYEQQSEFLRFYSNALSGATYVPATDLGNIYEIIGSYKPRNWYIGLDGSPYSNSLIPSTFAEKINATSSKDFYEKSLTEYGLTLKSLFSPKRLIDEAHKNYIEVDLATTESLDIIDGGVNTLPAAGQLIAAPITNNTTTTPVNNILIDGFPLRNGMKFLVKDQKTRIVLSNTIDPNVYFLGEYKILRILGSTIEYEYYNELNGIYQVSGGDIFRTTDLLDYSSSNKFSVVVKMGAVNKERQFHLKRLTNGFFPTLDVGQPIEFVQKKNWMIRNKVNYNNIFEINHNELIKHGTQSYFLDGITYSIPERTILVGEFGTIMCYQNDILNLIRNKYKNNLRSITETSKYYWICGDSGLFIRVRKHDFQIERIPITLDNKFSINLTCVSFFSDLRGVVVGDLNTIFYTVDSGENWTRLRVTDLDPFYFTKCLFVQTNTFIVVGRNGILVEFNENLNSWTATRRRISKFIDDDDENLLVDNINDILRTQITTWNPTFSYLTQSVASNKDLIFLTCDSNKLIAWDYGSANGVFDFLYFDLGDDYGDITNIAKRDQTLDFYFTGLRTSTSQSGIFKFDLSNFGTIGIGNSYSNTLQHSTFSTPQFITTNYPNQIIDYNGNELIICGNESLRSIGTYSLGLDLVDLDQSFKARMKSRLLYLDYDAGSKLNFFTDFGDYRLPNQLRFRGASFSGSSDFSFQPIVYDPTFPDFVTQSEVNWWKYWQDINKTFQFYHPTSPLDESTTVLASATFSYSATQSLNQITLITNTASIISYLAPKITEPNHSRYNGMGLTAISDPLTTEQIYLYDYLMVFKTTDFGYPVKIGDVMKFDSSSVSGNFVVNRIETLSTGKYIYMFTEFDDTMIYSIKSATASIKNLNTYSSSVELVDNFNHHPISKGYLIEEKYIQEVSAVNLFPQAGQTASLWTIENLQSSNSFVVPSITTQSPNSLITPTTGVGAQTASIISPQVFGVDNISFSYFHNFGSYSVLGTQSTVAVLGLSASQWINIATVSIPELAVVTPAQFLLPVSTTYSQFRFDFTTPERDPIGSGYMWISIQDLSLSSQQSLSVNTSASGVTYSTRHVFDIKPQFNTTTAYYNLATNVLVSGDKFTMSYTSGFLDFKYTPTYDILSYLEGLNDSGAPNPRFFANKEYLAMPDYRAIPMSGIGVNIATQSVIYIEYNGITYSNYTAPVHRTSNRIKFGSDLKLEWQSLLLHTFVDINLWDVATYSSGNPTSTTERLLIIDKYYDVDNELYVIEFHKNIEYTLYNPLYFIDIVSRRKLSQISYDLQELNNISKPRLQKRELITGKVYYNYERELARKFTTDSYAKILLSDSDTVEGLSAMMYTDSKGEMALNFMNLEEKVSIPIINTANFQNKLFIFCGQKHGLKTKDGVVLEFTGTTASSAQLNQQYFGYHPVQVVNEFNFIVDIPFGNIPGIGNDSGFVRYIKNDPFLEFTPTDLIEVGIDKQPKQSILIDIENVFLSGKIYSLQGVDLNRFRFTLIDQLDILYVYSNIPWLLEAEISDATIGLRNGEIVWYKGVWQAGRWFSGRWVSGDWISGDWYGGTWDSKLITDNILEVKIDERNSTTKSSKWYGGRWFGGTWNNGTWINGRWYGGTWNDGEWYRGIFNDGIWNKGQFSGGIWVDGVWNGGSFNSNNEPSFWLDGEWYGGDFENGVWYNGTFDQKDNTISRFGVNSYNSRTSIWHGGNWINGQFHSRLNLDDNGLPDVSDVHKYSIWYTGNWFNGEFYGGVAYNMNWSSGVWYGGILDDIQVIGLGNDGPGAYYLVLNGIFKFNTGDQFTIIDNNSGVSLSQQFGSNSNPKRYQVLYREEDQINKWTKIYVATSFQQSVSAPVNANLRVVSLFQNCNWKSGIWTNGIYEKGLWEGGIWYNGIFKPTWM